MKALRAELVGEPTVETTTVEYDTGEHEHDGAPVTVEGKVHTWQANIRVFVDLEGAADDDDIPYDDLVDVTMAACQGLATEHGYAGTPKLRGTAEVIGCYCPEGGGHIDVVGYRIDDFSELPTEVAEDWRW